MKNIAEGILGRKLRIADGMSNSEIELIEKSLEIVLPDELKEFYRLVGNLDIFMTSFENFIKPYIKDEKLVFLEENQGVCHWALNIQNFEDKKVYVCTDIESSIPEWNLEEICIDSFLKVLLHYQTVQGGYEYGCALYLSDYSGLDEYLNLFASVTREYEKVVEHNGLVIYKKDGKMIWHFLDDEGNIADTIFGSTRTKKEMEELEEIGFNEL